MKEVRAAGPVDRATVAMLSVPVRYRPCPGQRADSRSLRCDAPPPDLGDDWARIGGEVAAASRHGTDPDALHAAATLDLLSGDQGNSLDRSISYLEMTTRLAPTTDRYVDLSAALIARAGRDDDARSSVAALDAAARAVKLDSSSAAAHFNLALAMRDLGLDELARQEFWRAAELDPESGWGIESRELGDALVADTVVLPAGPTITVDAMAAFAKHHSNEARALSWERLAAWGRAFLSGDGAGSERSLRLAEAAGRAIAESHVDASIADAARAIRTADPAGRRALAGAHVAFVDGLRLTQQARAAAAESAFMKARQGASRSPSLAAWARYQAGNNRLALDDRPGAEDAMRRVLASPAAARYPALAAKAQWALGVVLLRNRELEEAARAISASRDLYRRLGEPEYLAAMTGQLGEMVNIIGDSREAYALMREAMQGFRNYPASNWRHNTMLVMSRAAAAEGLDAAAAMMDAEDEAASRAANRTWALVESQVTRARMAAAAGDTAAARRAIGEGRALVARLPEGNVRSQLESDLAVESASVGRSDDAPARAKLDSAIRYFNKVQNSIKELRAYSTRAAIRIRAGDLAGADADLDEALSIYETRRDNAADATQRSLLARQADAIAGALTRLRLRRGDSTGALAAHERPRAGGAPPAPDHSRRLSLDFSIIGDTLVIFAARGSQLTASVLGGEATSVVADVERATLALERGAPEAEWGPPLERLYGRLIGPIAAQILPSDTVVTIIAAGALSRVPFAALRDPGDKSYFIDRHALRFASSLRQATAPRLLVSEMPRVLLVADPVVDRRAFPGLAPLANASAEVDSIARLVDQPRVLRGAEADTTAMKQALAGTEVFHFAGHAVLDDARPRQSLLVTGSSGLTADAIAHLKLPALQLVVLSACETNRAPVGAGAGFLGLAESFMSAGARGAIGSTWKVDDRATQRLMQAFYESLSRTRDPVIALRDAQRSMRSAPPGAWAAFRYAGT